MKSMNLNKFVDFFKCNSTTPEPASLTVAQPPRAKLPVSKANVCSV